MKATNVNVGAIRVVTAVLVVMMVILATVMGMELSRTKGYAQATGVIAAVSLRSEEGTTARNSGTEAWVVTIDYDVEDATYSTDQTWLFKGGQKPGEKLTLRYDEADPSKVRNEPLISYARTSLMIAAAFTILLQLMVRQARNG